MLTSSPQGVTDYIEADLREPDKILDAAARTLDFTQPVAIMLLGILHFIRDVERPHQIVTRLLDAVPSGSHMALTHATLGRLARDDVHDQCPVSNDLVRATSG